MATNSYYLGALLVFRAEQAAASVSSCWKGSPSSSSSSSVPAKRTKAEASKGKKDFEEARQHLFTVRVSL